MKADLQNLEGAVVGSVDLDESVWGIEPNIGVMHQALVRQQANARVGTHETKTRAQVRGGGRKPWRQKGTGRARQGSTRAPNWVGGGVVSGTAFAELRRRTCRSRCAIWPYVRHFRRNCGTSESSSSRCLASIEGKTKAMQAAIDTLPVSRSYLLVIPDKLDSVVRGSGNLENVHWVLASYLNVRDILKYERMIVMQETLDVINGVWALPDDRRQPSVWAQARKNLREEAARG